MTEYRLYGSGYKSPPQVPKDYDLFYRCKRCDGIIPSMPFDTVGCGCGYIKIFYRDWRAELFVWKFELFEVLLEERTDNNVFPEGTTTFKYSFRDSVTRRGVSKHRPLEGDFDEIVSFWNSLGRVKENYIRVKFENGKVLKLFWSRAERLHIMILCPEEKHTLKKLASFEDGTAVLIHMLRSGGDPTSIPDLERYPWREDLLRSPDIS